MKCSEDVDREHLFSEEFVLLRGSNYEETYRKAEAKGKAMAHSYLNDAEREVRWDFQAVLEIRLVMEDELVDGSEIYARTSSSPPEVVPRGVLDE
jgi:Domain of unknown function (DUF4288)